MARLTAKPRLKSLPTLVIFLFILALLICLIPAPSVPIKPGPDTTVITSPLLSDGSPDYLAAINAIAARGLNADDNAAPLLIKAFHSEKLLPHLSPAIRQALHISLADVRNDAPFILWEDRNPSASTSPALSAVLADAQRGSIHPDLELWLQRNNAALDLVTQASHCSCLYLPFLDTGSSSLLWEASVPNFLLSPTREAALALAARAHIAIHNQDPASAWNDCLTLFRLARLHQQFPTYLWRAVSFAIHDLACDLATRLIAQFPLPPQQARDILSQLLELVPINDAGLFVDTTLRYTVLQTLIVAAHADPPIPPTIPSEKPSLFHNLDWNLALQIINAQFDRDVQILRLPPNPRRTTNSC